MHANKRAHKHTHTHTHMAKPAFVNIYTHKLLNMYITQIPQARKEARNKVKSVGVLTRPARHRWGQSPSP